MLASGLLAGAEGERLQSGVADRRLTLTSELPADSPAACTFAAHHRAGPRKGLTSGEVEEQVGGGPSGRCRLPSKSARCASDVGAGAAGGLGEHGYQPARWRSSTLQVRLLVGGGDAGITEQLSHAHDGRRTL
jgi:hypothetical protein